MSNKKEIVPAIAGKEKEVLSKQQKQFNYRTKRIKNLKKKIDMLKERTQGYFSRYQEEIVPVEDKLLEQRVEFLQILDTAHNDKFFKKKEKRSLAEIIENESFELLQELGVDASILEQPVGESALWTATVKLIELHDKHSEESFKDAIEGAKEEEKALAKSFIEEMFDVEIDDIGDLGNEADFADLQQRVEEQMREKEREYKESRRNRKKTQAQQEKEDAMEQEAQNLSKTSRTIYTDLVKELHPDKEQDEAEKERKTEIMKRVTAAYNNGDFFELLKLQIEYKQGDAKIEGLKNDQLEYYNKILMDQVRELQQEEYMLKYPPPPLNQIFHTMEAAKTYLKDQFNVGILRITQELNARKKTNKYVSNNKNLRKYIKDYETQEDEYIDPFDMGDLSWLFA